MSDTNQLEAALRNAHAAGDIAAAQQLANEIIRVRGSAAPQPQESAQPAPGYAPMILNSLNKGIAAVPDSLLNVPNRVMNLGKAAFGAGATALGRPDLAPELTPDPNLTMGALEKMGSINSKNDPVTPNQRMVDALAQGASSSLFAPVNGVRQVATNMALGSAGGGASGAVKEATGNDALAIAAGLGAAGSGASLINKGQNAVAAAQLRRQQNAIRDNTASDARAAGYTFSPSETNPGALNNILEGIAGKLSTRQLASLRNQYVTNDAVRQDVGLPSGTAISKEVTQSLRNKAYQDGFEPIAKTGEYRTDALYKKDLDSIAEKYTGAANSFPDAVKNDVKNLVDSLRVAKFDASDALKMFQILRDDSKASYAKRDTGLGKAQKAASNAVIDQMERQLIASGSGLLQNFRDAHTQMAKTHTIDKALHKGTGNISALKLAAAWRKGAPISGGMELAARAADAFPRNMQSPETMGAVPGISPLDVMGGAGLGNLGAIATGSPLGALAAITPAARPLIRSVILSGPYQKLMGAPSYNPGRLNKALSQGDVKNPQINAALLAQILAQQNQGGQ